MAPPPRTTSDAGTSLVSIASWLVQYSTSASPGIGGIAACDPVATTIAVAASSSRSPTSTRPGPVTRPWPRMNRPPFDSKRSTATRSSQSSVASARMRFATGAQSGVAVARPAMPSTRPASASRSAARIIIFDGIHPQ